MEEMEKILDQRQTSLFSRTLTFKDIISNYEDFMDLWEIYKIDDIKTMDRENNNSKIIYNTLYNYFCNSSTIYSTYDAFLRNFYKDIYNYADYYSDRNNFLNDIKSMDLAKINRLYQSVSNSAENNNALTQNPLSDIINFISSQNVNYMDGNEFDSFLKKLKTLKTNYIEELINVFRKHFVFIYDDPYCFYQIWEGGPEDVI